jgi:imidazolonepropionase-like amidohydrolase
LRTGTINVARFLNQKNAGVVQRYARADLVLLAANPLDNINNTRQIQGVMLNGKWLSKAFIDKNLVQLRH